MDTPVKILGEIEGLDECFDACNTISSLTYEREEGKGSIVFASPDHPNIACTISLLKPISLRDYRAVRKVLQMATCDLSLLSNGMSIYGLGHMVGEYEASSENLFTVHFVKHHDWELRHAGQAFRG